MGLLAELTAPLSARLSTLSTPVLVATILTAFIVLSVVLNVLSQLLFQNPNEPPLVFHWFPIIGNTITYGIEPYSFFFSHREKVRLES